MWRSEEEDSRRLYEPSYTLCFVRISLAVGARPKHGICRDLACTMGQLHVQESDPDTMRCVDPSFLGSVKQRYDVLHCLRLGPLRRICESLS